MQFSVTEMKVTCCERSTFGLCTRCADVGAVLLWANTANYNRPTQ